MAENFISILYTYYCLFISMLNYKILFNYLYSDKVMPYSV